MRRRLHVELRRLNDPPSLRWDLTRVEALDSAAALLLWRLWRRQWPTALRCDAALHHWFERLAEIQVPSSRRRPIWLAPLYSLGAGLSAAARDATGMLVLIGQILIDLGYCLRHPRVIPWQEISATVYKTGASSMPLLGVVGLLIGVVMTVQIGMDIARFGASQMIVGLLGVAVLRELAAVITAIILAGRSGSAMTASLAAMHITEEFDALRTFGARPSLRLVLPRVIGMGLSVPLLIVWTDFVALLGGAITAQAQLGVSRALFFTHLPSHVPLVNFWIGLFKGCLFGLTIAVVSCFYGLNARADTESLSHNTTLAVVTELTLIILLDGVAGALLTNVGLF